MPPDSAGLAGICSASGAQGARPGALRAWHSAASDSARASSRSRSASTKSSERAPGKRPGRRLRLGFFPMRPVPTFSRRSERLERHDEQWFQDLRRALLVGHDDDALIHRDKFGMCDGDAATVCQMQLERPERLLPKCISDRIEIHLIVHSSTQNRGPRFRVAAVLSSGGARI